MRKYMESRSNLNVDKRSCTGNEKGKFIFPRIRKGRYLVWAVSIVLLLAVLQIVNWSLGKLFYINLTASEPRGIYRIVPIEGELKLGERVFFEVPEAARPYVFGRQWLPPDGLLLKEVGALPGDEYRIDDTSFYINEEYIGPVSTVDRHRKPLPRLRGFFRVPDGYFLPVSQYIPNSFDGRYFGTVPIGLIRGKAVPVWIID